MLPLPQTFDHNALDQLRWWLKLLPTNLIARRDVLRFRHALYLIVHQIAAVLFGLNGQSARMMYPSALSGGRARLDELAIRPDRCGSRLEQIVTTPRMDDAWMTASWLIADVVSLVDSVPPASGLIPAPPQAHVPSFDPLSRQIAQRYQSLTGIDAIALTGSLARGYADTLSDIDLSVYCRTLPSREARVMIVEGLPGVHDVLIEHACDTAWVEGTLVHIRYWLTGDVEEMVAALPDPPPDAFLAEDLQVCVPLYDVAERLSEWKARIQVFPPHLKAALLDPVQRRRSAFAGAWAAALAAQDALHLYCLANQAANDWLIALFAVNNRFLTTPRWCRDEMRRFMVIPEESEARLRKIVGAIEDFSDVGARWNGLNQLWEELLTIGAFGSVRPARVWFAQHRREQE